MLLAIDVGNTNTVLGVLDGAVVRHEWRISTASRTADELGLLIRQLLAAHDVDVAAIHGVAVGTVVPAVVRTIEGAVRRYLRAPVRVVEPTRHLAVTLPDPAAIGPDRLINVIAARTRLTAPFLIVDFGTATTFDAVDASGAFVGGAIAPGLGIITEALTARTARLPKVDPDRPPAAIDTNTKLAMQSGLYYGYVGLVDGLARRMKAELGGQVRCVATGGLSAVVGADCAEVDEVDATLTLQGLRICYELETR